MIANTRIINLLAKVKLCNTTSTTRTTLFSCAHKNVGASLTTIHSSSPRANVAHLAVHLVPSWPLLCHVIRRCLSVLWSYLHCCPSEAPASLAVRHRHPQFNLSSHFLIFLNTFMIAQPPGNALLRNLANFDHRPRKLCSSFYIERVYSPFLGSAMLCISHSVHLCLRCWIY